ncbi:hypothetical protein SAMN02927895_00813 [Belnapia rosea]|nr:hypothetical protein SAMN02927895_00813 [Belnapia rosea]
MAGYVAPPRTARPGRGTSRPTTTEVPEPRTFRDLVLSVPQLLGSVAERLSLVAFGRNMRPLTLSDIPRAARPDFYREPESRIQDVLAQMHALPSGELGVLVTDLFLTGEELFGGAAAIRAPLSRILESDRAIGLMGIRSGFSGTIFDIPGARTYDGASERPFYVVATGPAFAVAKLFHRVEIELLSPLPPLADGQPRSFATIFTRAPLTSGPVHLPPSPIAPALNGTTLFPDLGAQVRRVSFPNMQGTATAPVPVKDLALPGVLLPDIFRIDETVWAETPRGARVACSDRWIQIKSLPASLATMDATGDPPTVTVGGSALARLPPGVPFLLDAKVTATGLSESPAATAWTRSWNLEPRDAEAFTASRPRLFRTLHLREVAVMLESLVRESLAPHPVGEILLALQVPRR